MLGNRREKMHDKEPQDASTLLSVQIFALLLLLLLMLTTLFLVRDRRIQIGCAKRWQILGKKCNREIFKCSSCLMSWGEHATRTRCR